MSSEKRWCLNRTVKSRSRVREKKCTRQRGDLGDSTVVASPSKLTTIEEYLLSKGSEREDYRIICSDTTFCFVIYLQKNKCSTFTLLFKNYLF